MKRIARYAAAFVCAACIVTAVPGTSRAFAVDRNPLPVNTTEEISRSGTSFSKNEFVTRLQQTLRTGTVKDALRLYEEVPSSAAGDFDLQFLKASLLVSDGNLDEAKTICTALNKKDESNTDVIELLAYIAKLQGNTAERNKQIKVLLAKDKYNVAANIELAEDYFSGKNYQQARLYYRKALVREPENQEALFGLGRSDYFLGGKDSSKDTEAEATFNKILEKDPSYAPAYSYLGKIAAANSKYKVASDAVAKAIALDATNYDYYMDYGMYERYLGHFQTAEEAWTKAISLQPEYFLGYAYRAGLYDDQNKFAQALADYDLVIKYNPQYYFAYESIGVLALHQQQWKKAREAFEKCRQMDKTNNISYPLMVTYCYYKEKDKLNAKSYSDKILRKMDRSSIDYAMLRVFHDEAGEMPLPQKIAALDNSNKKGKMYFYMGLFCELFGGIEGAKEYYSKVVKMDSPMFFEYRLAEWSLGIDTDASKTN